MGAYQDLVQGAVILLITVMGALLDSTLDALVGIAVHNRFLLFTRWYQYVTIRRIYAKSRISN